MKNWVTAEELMAKLNSDPDFVAMKARKEEEQKKRRAKLRKAEAPLIEELQAVGCPVESAWNLITRDSRVRTPAPYPEVLPILVKHLTRPYPDPVLEGIARALAVPEAKFAWPTLIREYKRHENSRAKTGLADAISVVADEDLIDDVITLVRDPSQGSSRLLLLSALERSKDPQARQTLEDLADDPDLYKEIQVILRRLNRRKR